MKHNTGKTSKVNKALLGCLCAVLIIVIAIMLPIILCIRRKNVDTKEKWRKYATMRNLGRFPLNPRYHYTIYRKREPLFGLEDGEEDENPGKYEEDSTYDNIRIRTNPYNRYSYTYTF